MLESITLEAAVKYCTPRAKKLFESKITPIVTERISQYVKGKLDKRIFERESVKYISSAAGQCSTINTIAFPNTPKKLDDLYIPLSIVEEDKTEIVIDDEVDIFSYSNKLLVSDTAGMGKSTLSKKVFTNIVNQQNYIPVFIELRQLGSKCIANTITEKFGVTTDSPENFLNQLPLVYLFDGLDEVPADCKAKIILDIRKFIDALDHPKIMVTSRVESYLSEFNDFSRYTIKPLIQNEAFDLIRKYDPDGAVSSKLITGIQDSRSSGIKEFLSTPLYVSLLFCSYRHKTVIPQKKHLFYSQVYEALFESHDLSKEIGFVRPKNSNLDSSEFHLLLRRLGFWCLKHGGKIEFQRDELEIRVQEILSNTNGINTSATNFVKDLTTTVPLFVKEGSSIRWSHKSLMEYFSSMFICNDAKDKQCALLLHFYNSDGWSAYKNIFELCADIDFGSLRTSIVKEMFEKYLSYYQSSYNDITNKRIYKHEIDARISLTFCHDFGFKLLDGKNLDNNKFEISDDEVTFKAMAKKQNCEVLTMLVSMGPNKGMLLGLTLYTRESMIIDILKYKSPELFFDFSWSTSQIDAKKHSNIFKKFVNSSKVKKNKFYIISDNPDALINNSKNFSIINYLLSISGAKPLDANKVENELNSIKEDSSNGVDKLIGGLV